MGQQAGAWAPSKAAEAFSAYSNSQLGIGCWLAVFSWLSYNGGMNLNEAKNLSEVTGHQGETPLGRAVDKEFPSLESDTARA